MENVFFRTAPAREPRLFLDFWRESEIQYYFLESLSLDSPIHLFTIALGTSMFCGGRFSSGRSFTRSRIMRNLHHLGSTVLLFLLLAAPALGQVKTSDIV